MTTVDAEILTVPILELKPTQLTIGLREVGRKQAKWQKKTPHEERKYLASHLVPVVEGPGGKLYLIDHHHLALALVREGQESILIERLASLSHLAEQEFYRYMDKRSWLHPFDEHGQRQPEDRLPATILELVDDPFRSLAGELREAGGYAKETTPFSEFMWADYLRHRIDADKAANHPEAALKDAWTIAKAREASFLPGWCGP